MDFSGLKEAAQKRKEFESNSRPEFFSNLKDGRYIALFLYADERTSKKTHQDNFWFTFEMIKVLEGDESASCEGKRNVDMLKKNEYLMENIAKKLNQVCGIDLDEVESDMATELFKGSEEDGVGVGKYSNIPVFVDISRRPYEKEENGTKVQKIACDVDYTKMTDEDLKAYDLEVLIK